MANRNRENQLAGEGAETVRVGQVYKEDGSNKEVIPFHVDFNSSTVQFAPVGSGREDRMRTSDFLGRFKYQGQFSNRAEDQTASNSRASGSEDSTRRVSRDSGAVTTEADADENRDPKDVSIAEGKAPVERNTSEAIGVEASRRTRNK